MKKHIITVLTAALALLWCGCSEDENPSGASSQASCTCQQLPAEKQEYQLVGADTVVIITKEKVDTARNCSGTTMLVTPDTTRADTARLKYQIRSDSLLIASPELTAIAQLFMDIEVYVAFARQGTGTGIQGTWYPSGVAYEDPDSLNSIERAIADSTARAWSQQIADSTTTCMVVSATEVLTYDNQTVADEILDEWAPQSSAHSILAEKQSDCEVKFTGNKSGETVTVCGADGNAIVYTSSNADHATHIWYVSNPLQCPNSKYPDWWEEFLAANKL